MDFGLNQFSKLHKHMRAYLTYSQLTGQKASKEEIIKEIQSIHLDDALLILAKFTIVDEQSKSFIFKELKSELKDKQMAEYTDLFDLSNILYSIKWFLAYGTRNPFFNYAKPYPNYIHILLTILKISDYMVGIIDSSSDAEDLVIKSSLLLRSGEIDKAIIRQYVMFEKLALDKQFFEKNEYIDIQKCFKDTFGYTISQYISTLFSLNLPTVYKLNWQSFNKSASDWGISRHDYFSKVGIKAISNQILGDLSVVPQTHQKWALKTINNPYDYEELLSQPIFSYNNKLYPFSPAHINATIFDGLCFKLNICCSQKGKSFFPFFGRLFEKYISLVLGKAVDIAKISGYQYIPEFKYGKEHTDSSDSYVQIGSTLVIFEGKGGRIRKETKVKADPKYALEDFKKYVIKPILQANKSYTNILEKYPEKFKGIKKVIIISVSLQSFPKVPKFHKLLFEKDFKKHLHPHVKTVDYIGLSDLELFALIINKENVTLPRFILAKQMFNDYIPYSNYYYEKFGVIKRTHYLDEVLKEAHNQIKITFSFNK
ncbi:hypothetical protein [Cytobacillus praedii]|uniref:hypothetical protein n=1 Tax=Cytobacillus praedii TaxID=1742358 RepID=UPI002E1CA91C|nr:hypothetical protein [Cytobacillus praedii]